MYILKKSNLWHVILVFFVFSSSMAQSQEEMIECFRQSYKYELQKNYQQAIAELKKVKADTYSLNLRLSYLNADYKNGMVYYSKAINLRPNSVEARLGYVLPAAKLKLWKHVGEQYDTILQIDPNNYKANYYRGLMYYNIGKYDEAEKYIDKLTSLYPFDYDAVILSAWNAFYKKNKEKARRLFIQAKLIQPESASATEGLEKCK